MLSLLFGFVVSAVIFSLRVLRSGRFASSEVAALVALVGFVSLDLFLLGRSRVVSVGSSIDLTCVCLDFLAVAPWLILVRLCFWLLVGS